MRKVKKVKIEANGPVYVASSWRNPVQPLVVRTLRDAGVECYDFRNPHHPDQGGGFGWSEIDPDWQSWSPSQFVTALEHPVAVDGYRLDWGAMERARACVLVMPCGRSAHIEAGYFVGAGRPLHILLSDGEPELMYRMAYETGGRAHLTLDTVIESLRGES